ncbi:hypothetical protein [Mucilaginibacter sp. FT3.2]|uniref:hypothetical protein n=1 Tax=Mucilaginibacter sp. FT3.2 TaxID=2723090 RepID=UPI001613D819|nr:hypothetical protein [Mucilaginibacter sp. FT3.2]MBB6233891.1 hypothetical protein [Mucilaginibacter sp. FT3.2]
MVNRFYRFIALIILLFSGLSASARGGLYHINHKEEKKATISATINHHNPYSYDSILNNAPIQVINLQQHRSAHPLPFLYTSPNFYTLPVKYFHFIYNRDTSGLSRFRKLILFPFHAFW